MAEEFETVTVTTEGLVLDLILWRRYRRKTPGLVEQTLDMNRGLADLGPVLPLGTVIVLPVIKPAAPAQRPLIRLWD